MDSEAAVLEGGTSGKVVIPGNSRESLLVKRLMGATDGPRMPVGAEPLSAAQINLIRAWIDQGNFARGEEKAREVSVEPRPSHRAVSVESNLFAAKVRPILNARCYLCHGPDIQQNGLRLDSLAAALKGSATGKVITPGASEKSRLVRRLLGLDRPQMPYGGPPLSSEEIGVIRSWIDQGAPGPDTTEPVLAARPLKHWAYMKPVRPELPPVKNPAWCRNPIDYFVLARLEKEGLSPSPEASRETLIRRVGLDLIGLPPTPQEVDAFVADRSPDAYEKVVDRLLASPHYGERWARPWLDLARYADSNGYEKDALRVAWKYRDWVINALNQDMSFKDFTVEQIAGDMLSNATIDQKIATGFHRNTLLNREGGIDPEEQRFYTLVDRVNTTAALWLGSTLECAQCHNHKFDPFPQKDYYRLLAFFDNAQYEVMNEGQGERWIREPELELATPEQEKKSREIGEEIAKLETRLNTSTPELEAAQLRWESELREAESRWATLRPARYSSLGGAALTLLEDQSILARGTNPEADTYVLEARTELTGITGARVEVINDPSLPHGGPGRDPEGNFFLSAVEIEATPAEGPDSGTKIAWKEAVANDSQRGYGAAGLVSKKEGISGWAIDTSPSDAPLRRQLVLIPDKPFGFDHGTALTIRLKHEMRHSARNLGRFRLSLTSAADPASIVRVPARVRPILDIPVARRTEEQRNAAASAFRSITPLLKPTRDRVVELQKEREKLAIVTALVMHERQSYERPWTYLRVRGSFLSPGEKVYAGVPAILPPLAENEMPNRLGLATWMVDENNPLTARVTVNRFWQEIFGRGIVETAEDFGTQGERPTHPELLDRLATEFMRQSWSMKKIQRLMVTSAAYRQSSRATPEFVERDPYNRLLARGPSFRVEAEMVRDVVLAASGLLSAKMGGPSVFPDQPEGVWDRPYSSEKWELSSGEDRYRRGIYTFIRRTSPYPSLITFDAPSRESCTIRRVRTNTPLQALTTLNDPAFFDAARALARRLMKEGAPDAAEKAGYGFRLCVSRRPTAEELHRALSFYRQQLERFQADPKAARAAIGAAKPSDSEAAELAAWTMVANVLLSMDETLTKE